MLLSYRRLQWQEKILLIQSLTDGNGELVNIFYNFHSSP